MLINCNQFPFNSYFLEIRRLFSWKFDGFSWNKIQFSEITLERHLRECIIPTRTQIKNLNWKAAYMALFSPGPFLERITVYWNFWARRLPTSFPGSWSSLLAENEVGRLQVVTPVILQHPKFGLHRFLGILLIWITNMASLEDGSGAPFKASSLAKWFHSAPHKDLQLEGTTTIFSPGETSYREVSFFSF
jgi:hypothetical protein